MQSKIGLKCQRIVNNSLYAITSYLSGKTGDIKRMQEKFAKREGKSSEFYSYLAPLCDNLGKQMVVHVNKVEEYVYLVLYDNYALCDFQLKRDGNDNPKLLAEVLDAWLKIEVGHQLLAKYLIARLRDLAADPEKNKPVNLELVVKYLKQALEQEDEYYSNLVLRREYSHEEYKKPIQRDWQKSIKEPYLTLIKAILEIALSKNALKLAAPRIEQHILEKMYRFAGEKLPQMVQDDKICMNLCLLKLLENEPIPAKIGSYFEELSRQLEPEAYKQN